MKAAKILGSVRLPKLLDKLKSGRKGSRRSHRTRLDFESLERRELMAGDLIVNGSFEDDVVTDNGGTWQLYSSITGWTRSSGNYLELHRGILGGAAEGSQHMELDADGPSSISQTVTTVEGQAYKLTFSFAGRPGTATIDNILSVNIYDVTGAQTSLDFTLVAVGGGAVSDNRPQLPGGSGWLTYEAIVVASGTQTKIEFGDAGANTNGLGTFLDNVSFEETSESAPPVNWIVNGSFEQHIVTDNSGTWHLYPEVSGVKIPGWELELGEQIELQRGILGGAAEGYQHLELDSHPLPNSSTVARVAIAQTIDTIPGQVYQLRFAFAGRPDTGLADNRLKVELLNLEDAAETAISFTLIEEATGQHVAGNQPELNGGSGWKYYTALFVAGAQTKLRFEDLGTTNSLGSFIDDVSMVLVAPELYGFGDEGGYGDSDCKCGLAVVSDSGDAVSYLTIAKHLVIGFVSALNPHPIVRVNTALPSNRPTPDSVTAKLTFGGVDQGTVYYDATGFDPGDEILFAHQADATGWASGRYDWQLEVEYQYGSETVTRTFSGMQDVVNRSDSSFGRGWSLPELDRLDIQTDGVNVITGDNQAIWFADRDGTFVREVGDMSYSTLVKNVDGSYTLTSANGLRREFDEDGLLTARIDPLGNARSYAYVDGDSDSAVDDISTITDHVGRVVTFSYTAGRITSVEDFDGRVTALAYDGSGRLTSATENDPDGAGPQESPVTAYEYDATTGLLERIENPRGEETLIEYDHARKVSSITQACGGVSEYTAYRSLAVVDLNENGYDAAHPAPLVSASAVETRLDEHDNATEFVRDRYGNVVRETDALGNVTTYERNADGLVTRLTQADPDGAGPLSQLVTKFTYDSRGNLTHRTNADLTEEFWTYDAIFSQLTSYTDQLGRQTFWEVSAVTGLTLSMTRVVGLLDDLINLETDDVVTTFTYTDGTGVAPPGLVETVTDALGVVTSYLYDAFGRVTSITMADGTADETATSFEYDTSDNLTAVVDGLGRRTEYGYDGLDRLITVTEADPDGAGPQTSPVWQYQYDADGNRTHLIDPLGNITEYVYDERGRLVEVISPDPDGASPLASPVTTYDFDCVSNLVSMADALGRTTEYEYDELNRLVNAILPDPDGAGPLATPEVSQSYNAVGWLASETDALGNVTLYAYDAMGRVLSITGADPDGAGPGESPVTSYTYDDAGQLLTITDPLGRVTSYAYDDLGRVTSITQPDPDGGGPLAAPVTTFTYDKLGNLLTETDALGNVTTYAYDNLSRLVSVTLADPDDAGPQTAPVTTYVYDAASQLVSVTDALENVTTYDYDNLGRQISITQADPDGAGPLAAAVTAFTYDAVGNLLTLTDALGNVTEYEYDNLYRLIAETITVDSVAETRTYAYDLVGNLIEKTDRNGRATQFDYDDLDRLIEERWYDGAVDPGNLANTVVMEYDVGSRLTSIADDFSSYAYEYDNLHRVVSVSNAGTPGVVDVVLSTQYNARGNRISLAATINGEDDFLNTFEYDNRDLIVSLTQESQSGGNAVAYKRVELAYDAQSRFAEIHRYASAGTGDLVASTMYTYDDIGRLTALTHAQGVTALAGYSWQYDSANRVTQFVSVDGTVDYSYDDTDQLTGAAYTGYGTDENYSYDENGNRTNAGYSSGDQNRLETDGTYDYLYDEHGNRIRRTHSINDTVTVYGWDVRNRLISVTEYASTEDADEEQDPTQVVEYVYDMFNRKIAKTVDTDGDSDVDLRERYIWSDYDANIVLDFVDDNLDGTAEADELSRRYLWGPAVDQLFAQENVDSLLSAAPEDVRWALADNLGSVRDLAVYDDGPDTTNIDEHYIYAGFGIILSGDPAKTRYLYTTQELDIHTGLFDYNARYYDAYIGQFISPDFIKDNLNNDYIYVTNSPTNAVDPTGLQELANDYTPYGGHDIIKPKTLADLPERLNDPINRAFHAFKLWYAQQWTDDPNWKVEHDYVENVCEWEKKPKAIAQVPEFVSDLGGGGVLSKGDDVLRHLDDVHDMANRLVGPGQRLAGQIDTIAKMRPFADRLADATANPSCWKVVKSVSERSTNIKNKGGYSLQEILRNEQTGETIVRHTLFKPDGSIFEAPHFRPYWK